MAITPKFRQPGTYLVQGLPWTTRWFPQIITYQNTTKILKSVITSLDNRGVIIRPFQPRSVNLTEMSKREKHPKEMVQAHEAWHSWMSSLMDMDEVSVKLHKLDEFRFTDSIIISPVTFDLWTSSLMEWMNDGYTEWTSSFTSLMDTGIWLVPTVKLSLVKYVD